MFQTFVINCYIERFIEYKGLGIASSQTATGMTADYENRTGAFETVSRFNHLQTY